MLQVLSAKVEREEEEDEGWREEWQREDESKRGDKVRLKTMSACFLGWKGRKKER